MKKNMERLNEKVREIEKGISSVLITKNKRYGNSALKPNNVFFKGDSVSSIRIRLDDKIGRVRNSKELRKNDMFDILGYLILFIISEQESRFSEKSFEDKVSIIMGAINDYIEFKINTPFTFLKEGSIVTYDDGVLLEMDYIINNNITGKDDDAEQMAALRLASNIILYFVYSDITDFSDLID